jgi:allantoin racemase
MGIRIWHQAMAELDDLPAYKMALAAHAPRVVRGDTEVVLHGATPGSYLGMPPAQLMKNPYIKGLIQIQIVDHCRTAEAEGYDAVAVATFAEPFLHECRSAVSIPVAAMSECALMISCSLARQFALVSLTGKHVYRARALVSGHGLTSRVSGFYALEPAVTEHDVNAAFEDPAALLENFTRVARRAIAEGADAIIPADGLLAELIATYGERRIDDVPVLDMLGAVLSQAELMVQLRRTTGLEVGRAWSYPMASADLIEKVRVPMRGSQ